MRIYTLIKYLQFVCLVLALTILASPPSEAAPKKIVILPIRLTNDIGVRNAQHITTNWLTDSTRHVAPQFRIISGQQAASLARVRLPQSADNVAPSTAVALMKSIGATHVLGGDIFLWKKKYGVTLRLIELPDVSQVRIERDWTQSVEEIPSKIDELTRRIFSLPAKNAPVTTSPIETGKTDKPNATSLSKKEKRSVTGDMSSQKIESLRRKHPEMVYVPGGEFLMGNDNESDADNMPVDPTRREGVDRHLLLAAEKPERFVYVRSFLIDKYEVTNAEYAKFKPSHAFPAEKSKHPVRGISWHDAHAYAEWAGKRLPTEEEWEKAARGADGRKWPWGNIFEKDRCNLGDSVKPVGSFAGDKSPYGAYDMAGNVQEWTSSDFVAYPGNTSTNIAFDSNKMVVRGSYHGGNDFLARCSMRFCALPGRPGVKPDSENYAFIGFRCAMDAE